MEYWGEKAQIEYIKRMEQIIAKHCSSQNLMNGNYYRYPVHYRKNGQGWHSSGLADVTNSKEVDSMHYKFGSHTMDIGKALAEILDFLDECYTSEYFDTDTYNSWKRNH